MRLLEELEKASLEANLKKTKDVTEWKRIFAILEYDNGQSIEELAQTLRLSSFTIEHYLKEYNSKNKTKNDPRGGSDSKLTPDETRKLEQHLTERTYLKVQNIIAFVKQAFNKKYCRSGMNAWLKDHHFVYKRPETIPGKCSPARQAEFVQEYRELKNGLKEGDELYFLDEMHPEYQSQAVCGWIKKGECKTIQTTGKQSRLHFAGAISLPQMNRDTSEYTMNLVIDEYTTIDGDAMVDFLTRLEEKSKAKRIHIILDNGKAHRNKKIEEYLKTSRIELHYLPPYSPNLNPIERLWKILREQTQYNHYYPSANEFFTAVREFFGVKIRGLGDLLRRRINDNFEVIKPNPINI